MQLVDKPYLFPGRCFKCSRTEGEMLDTRLEDAMGQRIYLCAEVCLPEVGRLFDGVPLDEHRDVTRRLTSAHNRISQLEERIAGHGAELAAKQQLLDRQDERLGELRLWNQQLEERIAGLLADPGVVERQRMIARLTGRDVEEPTAA